MVIFRKSRTFIEKFKISHSAKITTGKPKIYLLHSDKSVKCFMYSEEW
jgi:cAMP phosphodiesterase